MDPPGARGEDHCRSASPYHLEASCLLEHLETGYRLWSLSFEVSPRLLEDQVAGHQGDLTPNPPPDNLSGGTRR